MFLKVEGIDKTESNPFAFSKINDMKYSLILLMSIFLFCSFAKKENHTLYLMGDSTMADKPDSTYPERGWGQLLPSFFDLTRIKIENHAQNGRSTRSFIYEGRWDSLYAKLKPGDYLVIQFGHNDEVETKTTRYATPEEFRYNLKKFVKEARSKGAIPILCTSVVRRNFVEGKLIDTHGDYPGYLREVAAEMNVPLIDMQQKSQKLVSDLGEEGSLPLYLQVPPGIYPNVPEGKIDNTHFSEKGATMMAGLFVDGLNELNHPLTAYLKDEK